MPNKHSTSFIHLSGAILTPWVAFAHGEVDDGHVEEVAAPDPGQRTVVLAVVVAVSLLLAGFLWWSRSKNISSAPKKGGESDTPTTG